MGYRYLPDLPPETSDIWTVCDGFHADRNGLYRTGFLSAAQPDVTGLAAAGGGQSGRCYRTASGTLGIVTALPTTGSPGKLNVFAAGAWTDRRGALGVSARSSRAFVQYGNITLVADFAGVYWRDATGVANFAAVAASPLCSVLLVTPQNIIVALRAEDSSTNGTDAWGTSDIGDYTNWTTGEAASGNLRQTPGALTAGVVFGNDVIAFKRRGVYRGQYVGGVVKWKWDLIHPSLGAWGPGCVVSAADKIYFMGDDGFHSFDGATFNKLDIGIATTLQNTIADPVSFYSGSNYVALDLVYDSIGRRIGLFNLGWINGLATHTTQDPQHFTYQIDSGLWGYQSKLVDSATNVYNMVLGGAEELNSFSNGTWAYNTNFGLVASSNEIHMVATEFTSANVGTTFKPKLRTFRLGKHGRMTTVTRFIPDWTKSDGAGTDLTGATLKTATPYISDSPMEAETGQTAVTLTTDLYRADYTKSSRYQSVEIQIGCEAVIAGGEFEYTDSGSN